MWCFIFIPTSQIQNFKKYALYQEKKTQTQESLIQKEASLVAQLVKNPPAMWEAWVQSLGWEDPWRRERLPTPVFWAREFHGLCSLWGRKELDVTE